jgi:hypothetical protein
MNRVCLHGREASAGIEGRQYVDVLVNRNLCSYLVAATEK